MLLLYSPSFTIYVKYFAIRKIFFVHPFPHPHPPIYLKCAGVVALVNLDLEDAGSHLVLVQSSGCVVTTGHLGNNSDMKKISSSQKITKIVNEHWAEMWTEDYLS